MVVDDAEQGVTHIVRGTDLLESTGRQIYLQRMLGYPTPQYMHVPVVLNDVREKLSKQTGALALDLAHPMDELMKAASFLGLEMSAMATVGEFWGVATDAWARRFCSR